MECKDDLLNAIAARAEADPSFSPGLSLLVDGIFISGFVMSSAAFAAALNGGTKAGPVQAGVTANLANGELPEYIHLKGVRFYAGSGQQIEERTGDNMWRCRISAVSGFKLGTLHYVSARVSSGLGVVPEHA